MNWIATLRAFPKKLFDGTLCLVIYYEIFKTVFVPILTYVYESWVMTERFRSQVQAFEMRFLQRIEGVTLLKKVYSSEIQKFLGIEPLLLQIERSSLRSFSHVSRMPQKRPQTSFTCQSKWKKEQLGDLELDRPIIMKILDGITWHFTQA